MRGCGDTSDGGYKQLFIKNLSTRTARKWDPNLRDTQGTRDRDAQSCACSTTTGSTSRRMDSTGSDWDLETSTEAWTTGEEADSVGVCTALRERYELHLTGGKRVAGSSRVYTSLKTHLVRDPVPDAGHYPILFIYNVHNGAEQ